LILNGPVTQIKSQHFLMKYMCQSSQVYTYWGHRFLSLYVRFSIGFWNCYDTVYYTLMKKCYIISWWLVIAIRNVSI